MNLLELFFSSLRSYTQAVRENTSPASHYPYPNSIHSRLEFLEFVCRYSSLDLKGKHIDILWENVILSPASPEIADTGYLFLRNALRSMNGVSILSSVSVSCLRSLSVTSSRSVSFVTSSNKKSQLSLWVPYVQKASTFSSFISVW